MLARLNDLIALGDEAGAGRVVKVEVVAAPGERLAVSKQGHGLELQVGETLEHAVLGTDIERGALRDPWMPGGSALRVVVGHENLPAPGRPARDSDLVIFRHRPGYTAPDVPVSDAS